MKDEDIVTTTLPSLLATPAVMRLQGAQVEEAMIDATRARAAAASEIHAHIIEGGGRSTGEILDAYVAYALAQAVKERDNAFKALREIGERAICDWHDEMVGLVSAGLGTTDWDKVVTLEMHEVSRLRKIRDEQAEEIARLKAMIPWDRTPGCPDVPVLQARYDRLKEEIARLRARVDFLERHLALYEASDHLVANPGDQKMLDQLIQAAVAAERERLAVTLTQLNVDSDSIRALIAALVRASGGS